MMLSLRKNSCIFYHKDTNEFDYCPVSRKELERLSPDARLPVIDRNNYRFPSYEEIDHKDIMRFYTKEYVEDKEIRSILFNILRRFDYMDAYLDKLRELDLYQDFLDACGVVRKFRTTAVDGLLLERTARPYTRYPFIRKSHV